MCTKDCYKVFGYFFGFMWIVSCFYYTMETIELLKLMNLQCSESGGAGSGGSQPPPPPQTRMQFDEVLIKQVCEFYGHLAYFMPYHIITTIIKMVPGMLLIVGVFRGNITLVKVFIFYAVLEEIFFVVVFSKIFTLINTEGKKSPWMFWMIVFSCVKLIVAIWILLGVYASIDDSQRVIRRYV
ncbi:uncharacterized protein LOC129758085 [Uranotaenia lowii]|uniref:uncharacterized protein LOC129758085 n=1 Tax=Uranotaenia lowii TaxID=190385 RepID=UPI00247A7BCA|nr:uncharacterized protein LOC129758085 [Uranotaenia lowii]